MTQNAAQATYTAKLINLPSPFAGITFLSYI